MPDPDFIFIDKVSKEFGDVKAVNNVEIGIARGEFFALLGPSGCGKTTLLRMLGGFEIPTSGNIMIDGEQMAAVPPNLRPVNTVFQNYAIFPHLNVFQNIAFGLRKERLSRTELAKRVDDALAMIRLQGYGKRAAHELSGGQRQRIALARALVKKPKVLLLDEPLGALDKKLREQMQIELRDLQKSIGVTFVFVTHDQEEALAMSDRIAVMSAGKVLEVAPPSQLYGRPTTRFVAEFLGAMNLASGVVRGSGQDTYVIDTDRFGQVTVAAGASELAAGERVTVGLRPENIHLLPTTGGPAQAGVTGVVTSFAYLGDRTYLQVATDGASEPVLVSVQNLAGSPDPQAYIRQSMTLTWPQPALLLLRDN